ncbi:MAG: OsmC family protein [Candidatus Limnocylindrales bacterium]
MAKTVVARWTAGMLFQATSGSGGRVRLVGDEGVAGYRPSELLLSALVGCTGMDVISICRKKRQVIDRYEVRAFGEQWESDPRSYRRIVVEHVLRGPVVEDVAVARAIRLSATRYCVVTAQLARGDVTIDNTYRVGASGCPDGELSEATLVVTVGPQGAGLEPR